MAKLDCMLVLSQCRKVFRNFSNRSASFFKKAGSCHTTAASRLPRGEADSSNNAHWFFNIEQLLGDASVPFDGEVKIVPASHRTIF